MDNEGDIQGRQEELQMSDQGSGPFVGNDTFDQVADFLWNEGFVLTFTGYIDSDRDAIQLVFDGL